ncbi:MAG: dockerin, partial [Myxococcales bacterium]|nr:dockerin [Myxococcales bacterium]
VGDGPVYWGLYSMIEDLSDELLGDQLEDHDGNLYKPEGGGARLSAFDEASFPKKTNEDLADFSDVQGLITAINASTSDAAAWRAGLEAVFDVDGYLRALATNQAIQNWDTYGWAPHNYYLYADATDGGRLRFLPWDLNESLKDTGNEHSDSILLEGLDDEWPLIRNLLDDATYMDVYKGHLQTLYDTAMHPDNLYEMMDTWHTTIEPFVIGDE